MPFAKGFGTPCTPWVLSSEWTWVCFCSPKVARLWLNPAPQQTAAQTTVCPGPHGTVQSNTGKIPRTPSVSSSVKCEFNEHFLVLPWWLREEQRVCNAWRCSVHVAAVIDHHFGPSQCCLISKNVYTAELQNCPLLCCICTGNGRERLHSGNSHIISVACSSANVFYSQIIKLPNSPMPWKFIAREMKKTSFVTWQRTFN